MFAYCNNNPVNEIDPDGENSLAGFADPNMSVVDNARPWESAVLALGLLAGAILAHETGKELGRYLLAELSKQSSSSTPAVKVSVSSPAPPPGPGNNRNKKTPRNQLQNQVEKGQAPKEVDRVDPPHNRFVAEQKEHLHFKDGTAINLDGTPSHEGHGTPIIPNSVIEWLAENGYYL